MFGHRLLAMVLLAGILFSQPALPAAADQACDWVQFISDTTVPDGSSFAPGAAFTKTWRLRNAGTCTWSNAYRLVFFNGDAMGAPAVMNLPVAVPPGQTVDLSVKLVAPGLAGHYRGYWKLSNASGATFGIGSSGSEAFWVDINVVEISAVVFDFVASAPYAQWKSGAGPVPFPGASGDSRGFAYPVNNPRLEDGSVDTLPGLLTVPQNKFNGYLQATYPEFLVQPGDRFQTLVNCEYGASGCYVTFRVDALLPTGRVKTLWQFKEAYDRRFYRLNLDLSSLAGQKVRLILMLLSTGSAGGDRALWGAPRIVRTGSVTPPAPPATLTPLPALTPTATPFSLPPTISPSGCDRVTFVADVTVPDGTRFAPGAAFTKTWRLKNSGSCAWTSAYSLQFYSGEQMGASTAMNLPWTIPPGQTFDLSINLVAPDAPGTYRGNWVFRNASGAMFGIGANAATPFWLEINVAGTPPTEMGYDFAANACAAEWKSGAGLLPCPGVEGNPNGYVISLNSTRLEDGTRGPAPSLLVAPQNKYNGYIRGYYPTFTVQPGDRFRTGVGCDYGASCYVTFQLDYMTANGSIVTLWSRREQNDARSYSADIDLTPLAGRSVRLILTLLATGSAANDRAVWAAPYLLRAPSPVPPTPTLTPVPPTPASDWLTYTNPKYGFEFKYPKAGQIVQVEENYLRANLPFTAGTNLRDKFIEVTVSESADLCYNPIASMSMTKTSEVVTINGLTFLKETGGDAGVGHFYKWVAYSTARGGACASLAMVLHSTNPGNYPTPLPVYDEAAETVVFTDMISTFAWLIPPDTPAPVASPTFTPTAVTQQGPYAVTHIYPSGGGELSVRAGPGAGYPMVASFPADATDVMRTGPAQQVDDTQWVQVLLPGGNGTGWVNAYYLTEYVSSEAFCSDARLLPLINQLRQSVNQSGGEQFAGLVSPVHGVDVRLWKYHAPTNFTQAKARDIFTSSDVYNWGGGPRGVEDVGTFAGLIQPKLAEVLNAPNMETYCDNLSKVFPLTDPWPLEYHGVHYYNLYKPPTPDVVFDFRTWLVGIEYVDGQPYLFGLVTIIWEP